MKKFLRQNATAFGSLFALAILLVGLCRLSVAQAENRVMAGTPNLIAFRYTMPSGTPMETVSWEDRGVRCTVTRAYTVNTSQPTMSCVNR